MAEEAGEVGRAAPQTAKVTRKVVVRPAADRDLDDQANYIASDSGISTALRFYESADETFRLLSSHPRMARAIELLNPFFVNVRVFPIKNFRPHIVFYRPLRRGIEILPVIHGSRDIERLLGG